MAKQRNFSQIHLTVLNQFFVDDCFPKDQNLLEEVNTDHEGRAFRMERVIVCPQGAEHLLFRWDPDQLNPYPYFQRNGSGMASICDYIIFIKRSYLYIFLVELKRGDDSAREQLELTEGWIRFCLARATKMQFSIPSNEQTKYVKIKVKERKRGEKGSTAIRYENKNGIIINHVQRSFLIEDIIDRIDH